MMHHSNSSRRAAEAEINAFPNFALPIGHKGNTYNTHFLALFSARPDAVPLLFLHGWPGSILEFLPLLRLLTSKYDPSTLPYHVIVPSLPAYAFSSPPPIHRDFRLEDAASIDTLMVSLGFGTTGYIVQGGDVGAKSRVSSGLPPHT